MKKIILLVLFLCLFTICQAQIFKFKATEVNIRFFNDTTKTYEKWLGWESCNLKVEMDVENLILFIHSEKEQKYVILKVVDKIQDKSKKITEFEAIDIENEKCIIKLINIYPTAQNYVHIQWQVLELAYELEKL